MWGGWVIKFLETIDKLEQNTHDGRRDKRGAGVTHGAAVQHSFSCISRLFTDHAHYSRNKDIPAGLQ
jgi:hypothetical protein